ncbi:MAG: methyl-accepting chemotaxis protein [Nitrospiraceae bacterium]
MLLLLVGLGVGLVSLYQSWQAVERTQASRYESYLLADELRQGAEDLTQSARAYVMTGEAQYREAYFRVLDVRNGILPRDDGRRVPLRTLMQQAGFTEAEFRKLNEAEDNSNDLVTTETIAMNAVTGQFSDGRGGYTRKAAPDFALAQRMMFDDKYRKDKAAIMAPVEEFVAMLDARTKRNVEEASAQSYRVLWAVICMLGMLAVVHCALVVTMRRMGGKCAAASGTVASQPVAKEGSTASEATIVGRRPVPASHAGEGTDHAPVQDRAPGIVTTFASNTRERIGAVQAFDHSSEQIGETIGAVNTLEGQARVVAVHAALQTARVGEQERDGAKGLADSNDMRQLVERAANASQDIARAIKQMQSAAYGAGVMRDINTQGMPSSAECADQTGQALQGIVEQSQRVAEMIAQIAAATEEQPVAGEQIGANIEAISPVISGMAEETQRITAGAGGRGA